MDGNSRGNRRVGVGWFSCSGGFLLEAAGRRRQLGAVGKEEPDPMRVVRGGGQIRSGGYFYTGLTGFLP